MRISYSFAVLVVIVVSLFPGQAEARRGWIQWLIPPAVPEFDRPYLEEGRIPQGSQWDNDEWSPEDWIASRGSKEAVLEGLEQADIIKDADIDADGRVTELDVGYNFLRLADQEKIRVVKFVDYASGGKRSGAILVEYDRRGWLLKDIPLGVYTPEHGLQLQ